MDLKRLETLGLIEKISPNRKQALTQLGRARRDLLTSGANLLIDEEWAYTIAYHAMLRAGRALLLAYGYRAKGKDQHKTVVEFSATILGPEFSRLAIRFNQMRMKRHAFIYEAEKPVSRTEAEKSLKSAGEFVREIAGRVERLI
ncbi:MAG: HEPN domain-containing protein [Candidatus Aminicenantales bacterium]